MPLKVRACNSRCASLRSPLELRARQLPKKPRTFCGRSDVPISRRKAHCVSVWVASPPMSRSTPRWRPCSVKSRDCGKSGKPAEVVARVEYSALVIEHFEHPRNVGLLGGPSVIEAKSGRIDQGAVFHL